MSASFMHEGQRFHICNDGKYRIVAEAVLSEVPEGATEIEAIQPPATGPGISASYGIKIAPGINPRQQEFIDRPETQAKLKSGEMRYMSKTDDEAHI